MYSKNVFDVFQPIFLLSIVLGTNTNFTRNCNGISYLITLPILKIITALYVGLYTIAVIYAANNTDFGRIMAYFENGISIIGFFLDAIGQMITLYVIYILSIIMNNDVKQLVEKLFRIDTVLLKFGMKPKYDHSFLLEICGLFAGFVWLICGCHYQSYAFNRDDFDLDFIFKFVYYFPQFLALLVEFQFFFLLFEVLKRFNMINKILRQMTKDKNGKPKAIQFALDLSTFPSFIADLQIKIRASRTLIVIRKIRMLMIVYDSLIDISNVINANYSLQITTSFGIRFIKMVFAVFMSYRTLNAWANFACWTFWSTINLFVTGTIAIICHLTTKEARQIGANVHLLIIHVQESSIRRKLTVFSQQVFHAPAIFSASGLFPINGEILSMIVLTAITYVLIMLQFQEDEGDKPTAIVDI